MKAFVYHGPGQKAWEEVADPVIVDPTDVIVRVDTTTICGTDLHILKGDVPAVTEGRILGHEGVGTVTEIGAAVSTVAVGDRVIISCISACGVCSYCHQGLYAHCLADEGASGIGWIFGHLIDGTQAELVRVPFADNSVYKVPDGVSDEAAVMLSDILPTGFEIGVRYGRVKPGDVVAVVGAGPVGLAAMMTASLYGAARIIAIDLDANRLEHRPSPSVPQTSSNNGAEDWIDQVRAMTDGLGVDVAIEAVGIPATFDGLHQDRPSWRVRRQRRRARRTRRAGLAGPVDHGPVDHHRPGEHLVHGDAPQAGGPAQARGRSVRHPPLHFRSDDGGLRHVRPRRRDQGAQGRHQTLNALR